MIIKHFIQLTEAELMNIKNGLELLQEKCIKKKSEVVPLSDNAENEQSYFTEKVLEINNQINGFTSLLKK